MMSSTIIEHYQITDIGQTQTQNNKTTQKTKAMTNTDTTKYPG